MRVSLDFDETFSLFRTKGMLQTLKFSTFLKFLFARCDFLNNRAQLI